MRIALRELGVPRPVRDISVTSGIGTADKPYQASGGTSYLDIRKVASREARQRAARTGQPVTVYFNHTIQDEYPHASRSVTVNPEDLPRVYRWPRRVLGLILERLG